MKPIKNNLIWSLETTAKETTQYEYNDIYDGVANNICLPISDRLRSINEVIKLEIK